MKVLVVNAGSSSLKLSLIGEGDVTLAHAELNAPRAEADATALREALAGTLGEADAVGHRIVHGGARFAAREDLEIARQVHHLLHDTTNKENTHDLDVLRRVG